MVTLYSMWRPICYGLSCVPMILTSARWLCNRSPEDIIQKGKPGYTQLYSVSAKHKKTACDLRSCPCEHVHWRWNTRHFMLTPESPFGNCLHRDFFMWLFYNSNQMFAGYQCCSLNKPCFIIMIVWFRRRFTKWAEFWALGLTKLCLSPLFTTSDKSLPWSELSCWRWLGLFTCLYVESWCLLEVWQCFVHWLFNLGPDRVACQTQEKANKPDSRCIYILLCNSLDLFLSLIVVVLQQLTG